MQIESQDKEREEADHDPRQPSISTFAEQHFHTPPPGRIDKIDDQIILQVSIRLAR